MHSRQPSIDPDPSDHAVPCATAGSEVVARNTLSPGKIAYLGDEIASHIVAINEAHYGPIGNEIDYTSMQ